MDITSRLAITIALALVSTIPVPAQGTTALSPEMKQLMQLKRDVSVGSQPLEPNKAELSKWYADRLKTMATDREQMPKIRIEIVNDLYKARSDLFRQFLVAELLKPKGVGRIILNHPKISIAAKVNMMLIFGQLNDSEGNLRAGTLPTPSVAARELMLEHVNDDQQHEAVKIAAMVGLKRHVETNPASADGKLLGAMMRLATTEAPSTGADGHYWLKKQAAEVLGLIGRDNKDGVVTTALDAIIRDENAPRIVRCTALDAIGKVRPPQTAKVNVEQTAEVVGHLALESCQQEIARLQEWEDEQATLVGRFEEPRRVSADNKEETEEGPEQEVIQLTKRVLGHELKCILQGMSTDSRGLKALAKSPEEQSQLDKIVKPLADIFDSLNAKTIVLAEFKDQLAANTGQLARAVGAEAAPDATAPEQAPPGIDENNVFGVFK